MLHERLIPSLLPSFPIGRQDGWMDERTDERTSPVDERTRFRPMTGRNTEYARLNASEIFLITSSRGARLPAFRAAALRRCCLRSDETEIDTFRERSAARELGQDQLEITRKLSDLLAALPCKHKRSERSFYPCLNRLSRAPQKKKKKRTNGKDSSSQRKSEVGKIR